MSRSNDEPLDLIAIVRALRDHAGDLTVAADADDPVNSPAVTLRERDAKLSLDEKRLAATPAADVVAVSSTPRYYPGGRFDETAVAAVTISSRLADNQEKAEDEILRLAQAYREAIRADPELGGLVDDAKVVGLNFGYDDRGGAIYRTGTVTIHAGDAPLG